MFENTFLQTLDLYLLIFSLLQIAVVQIWRCHHLLSLIHGFRDTALDRKLYACC